MGSVCGTALLVSPPHVCHTRGRDESPPLVSVRGGDREPTALRLSGRSHRRTRGTAAQPNPSVTALGKRVVLEPISALTLPTSRA